MKPEDDASTARRQFVGGMTSGLAAAFVYPAFAQQGQQESCPGSLQRPSQSRKQDPRTQYPIPPFPPQKQEPPGLVSKMIPRPDHGETTYKGSGRLVGRKALVTGGDSGIGRAAAIAFAREGADVAINYLPVEESDAREVVKLIPGLARRLRWGVPANRRNSVPCMSFSRRRNQATQPDRCTVLQAGKGTLAQLTRPEAERSPSFDSPIY